MFFHDYHSLTRRNFFRGILFGTVASAFSAGCQPGKESDKGHNTSPTLDIQIIDRPYDHHRPDGCTVITIRCDKWPGNEFGLWLPEVIKIGNKIVWCNWRGEVHQDWERDSEGQLKWIHSSDSLELTSTLTLDHANSCIWYRHIFKNKSDKLLRNLNASTCFHLVNAPQFVSIQGERIWANLDGKWTTTDKVPRHKSEDPRRIAFYKKGVRSERTVEPIGFSMALMPEAAHHPLIIAENFNATASVGIASRNFKMLFNNNDSILRCIHSEPFPIETLRPGETEHLDGVIIFYDGDHHALLKHYENIAVQW